MFCFEKKVIKKRSQINKAYHVKFPNTCLKRHHLNEYSEIKNKSVDSIRKKLK